MKRVASNRSIRRSDRAGEQVLVRKDCGVKSWRRSRNCASVEQESVNAIAFKAGVPPPY
ncbi:MAG: hypothetical protein AB1861_18265 [Cyanobacteriota bacterium]